MLGCGGVGIPAGGTWEQLPGLLGVIEFFFFFKYKRLNYNSTQIINF